MSKILCIVFFFKKKKILSALVFIQLSKRHTYLIQSAHLMGATQHKKELHSSIQLTAFTMGLALCVFVRVNLKKKIRKKEKICENNGDNKAICTC